VEGTFTTRGFFFTVRGNSVLLAGRGRFAFVLGTCWNMSKGWWSFVLSFG